MDDRLRRFEQRPCPGDPDEFLGGAGQCRRSGLVAAAAIHGSARQPSHDHAGVDLLMESRGLGIGPSNPVTKLVPLTNDEFGTRQFLYPDTRRVPEPAALALFGIGIAAVTARRAAMTRKARNGRDPAELRATSQGSRQADFVTGLNR